MKHADDKNSLSAKDPICRFIVNISATESHSDATTAERSEPRVWRIYWRNCILKVDAAWVLHGYDASLM